MSSKRITQIEHRIARIKETLAGLGPMRPGSLTRQYKNPQEKSGSYWQLSYTRAMKSHSAYVRQDQVANVRREIANYKRFKRLTEQWIDLEIERSKWNLQPEKKRGGK